MKGNTQSRGAAISQENIFLNAVFDTHMGPHCHHLCCIGPGFPNRLLSEKGSFLTQNKHFPLSVAVGEGKEQTEICLPRPVSVQWAKWFTREIMTSLFWNSRSPRSSSPNFDKTPPRQLNATSSCFWSGAPPGRGWLHHLPSSPFQWLSTISVKKFLVHSPNLSWHSCYLVLSLAGCLGKKGLPLACVPQELAHLFSKECFQMQHLCRSTKKQTNLF